MITPYPWHEKKCAICGRAFKHNDEIKIVSTGKLERIGGLGMYRDSLKLNASECITHQACSDK